MKQSTKAAFLKLTRQLHAWMGILVFPLVFIVGFTGFYLNHSDSLFGFLHPAPYDETRFKDWPDASKATLASVKELTNTVWPGVEIERITSDIYHDRPSFNVRTRKGLLIVNRETSHYFIKTSFTRKTYTPDGQLLHRKVYWGSLFKWLHVRGWPSDRFGTFLADIASITLILFSLSGVILWWLPRVKRIRRRLQGLMGGVRQ